MQVSDGAAAARSPWGLLAIAVALDVSAILPVGIFGTFALEVCRELDVTASFIGVCVGAFFLTGSITAATLGSLIDRAGHRRVVVSCAAVSSVAQILGAAVADHPAEVVALSMIAGACFALMMPSTNAILGRVFPSASRTVAVCIKQSAVPLALLVGALAAPAMSSVGGWRGTLVGSGTLAAVAAVVFVRRTSPLAAPPAGAARAASGSARAARHAVLRFAVATMLASCLAGSLTAYTAVSLSRAGVGTTALAVALTSANLLGIAVRLTSGVVAQRRGLTSWTPVGAMMVAGGMGAALLGTGDDALVVIGTVIAFALGWGWTGLTYALVLGAHLDNAGTTGAMLQAGGMFGSASGPLLMAAVISGINLPTAWLMVAVISVAGGLVAAWPEWFRRAPA